MSKLDYLSKKYKPIKTSAPPAPPEPVQAAPQDADPPTAAQTEVTHRIGLKIVSREDWDAHRTKKRPVEEEADFQSGLRQKEDFEARMEIVSEQMQRGLQSTEIAASLDAELREKQRWEDPMQQTVRRRNFQAPPNRFQISAGYRWDGVVRGTDYERRWFEARNENRASRQDYVPD